MSFEQFNMLAYEGTSEVSDVIIQANADLPLAVEKLLSGEVPVTELVHRLDFDAAAELNRLHLEVKRASRFNPRSIISQQRANSQTTEALERVQADLDELINKLVSELALSEMTAATIETILAEMRAREESLNEAQKTVVYTIVMCLKTFEQLNRLNETMLQRLLNLMGTLELMLTSLKSEREFL